MRDNKAQSFIVAIEIVIVCGEGFDLAADSPYLLMIDFLKKVEQGDEIVVIVDVEIILARQRLLYSYHELARHQRYA